MARILLVEDDPAVRATVRAVLKRLEHDVTEAADGAAAIRAIERNSFDLVITDVIMPEVEGLEVVLAVRANRPECPVIAMSGGGRLVSSDFLVVASKIGADEILDKPFTFAQLQDAIKKVL